VRDRVWPTSGEYKVLSLLHTQNKANIKQIPSGVKNTKAYLLEGNNLSAWIFEINGRKGQVNTVGGEGRRYWVGRGVEGASSSEGENYSEGAKIKSWYDNPEWRTEISAYSSGDKSIEFVTVIILGDKGKSSPQIEYGAINEVKGVLVNGQFIGF